jgi:hypothetical protein
VSATSAATADAALILVYASLTAQSLFETFHVVRDARGSQGAPTDSQQDILRSMLVLALAGLDSSVKQLVKDTVPVLVGKNPSTDQALEDFAVRRLGDLERDRDKKYLVRLLRSHATEQQLIDDLIDDLTSDSMQSVDQLLAVCNVLGVRDRPMVESVRSLSDAFDVRNHVIHEMDINFAATNRNRTSRTRASMVRETNRVLEVTKTILEAVDELLSQT